MRKDEPGLKRSGQTVAPQSSAVASQSRTVASQIARVIEISRAVEILGRVRDNLGSESGRNSVVECQLPKLDVAGSTPAARSINSRPDSRFSGRFSKAPGQPFSAPAPSRTPALGAHTAVTQPSRSLDL